MCREEHRFITHIYPCHLPFPYTLLLAISKTVKAWLLLIPHILLCVYVFFNISKSNFFHIIEFVSNEIFLLYTFREVWWTKSIAASFPYIIHNKLCNCTSICCVVLSPWCVYYFIFITWEFVRGTRTKK